MSMVKAYNGKKCSDLQLFCSTWTSANTCPQAMLTRDIQVDEDDWSCGNSSKSSQTCNDRNESWNESDKYIPLDPPPEFQDNSVAACIEKFASDLVYKLVSDAYLVSCKMSWSIPCSQDCHMSESLTNNPTSWNGFRLCWTPELLPHKRLSILSASHNSLSTISSNLDDTSYIKSAMSHDVLTSKQISDMYNVPFDSDIYAVPVDVVQDRDRKYDTASDYVTTKARCRKSREASTEPIHVTVEEVRQYLHTLYSAEATEERKPGKKLRNNEVKSIRSQLGKPKKTKESGRAEKLKKCRQSFSSNIKETLCNIFRIKKLHTSDHCLGRRDATRSDEIGMRLSGHDDQNPPSPISKPSFSKRALPPLPKSENTHGEIIATDSTPLPSPEDFPPPPPLPFRTKKASNSVDFASSIEKVKDYGWYWGPISGEAAEKILSNEPDGSFIVRDSSDDYYIFSLTFKLNSIIRHVRIEHDKGNFSFGSSTRFKSHTIVDFIESAVEHSRSGRYLFFLHRRPVLGPMRVQLLHPVSRFKQVQSLQHMCRFVILKMVRRDLIQLLPLPRRVLDYLSTQHYYSEDLLDEGRNSSREDLDQLLPFRQEVFS